MRFRRVAVALVATALVTGGAHLALRAACRIPAPAVITPDTPVTTAGGVRRAGRSSVRRVGSILEVRLQGSPEEMGAAHARLLHDEMVETEGVVWQLFEEKVSSSVARLFLLDAAQVAYRNVAQGIAPGLKREIAASAEAFQPDPFAGHFAPFQRFVYLTALYDISLAYEHSPLVGCTTLTFSGSAAAGSPLLARAFDFDVHDVFDEKKAVFLVAEDGAIPFASVAWPGLVGVVSGMNREGLAAVVHGARGGPIRTVGEPVAHELRRILSHARSTEEAVRLLGETEPLVSHLVILQDAAGHAVVVERIPGARPFVRPLGERAAVSNHLEGPFAADPKNLRVRESTTTLPRRARGDELVQHLGHPATAADAVALLRDRRAASGAALPLGDRQAVDALIATHGVVMETRERRLWVSEAPHLLGRFVAFDLARLLDPALPPDEDPPLVFLPEDPLLTSGEYARWRATPTR